MLSSTLRRSVWQELPAQAEENKKAKPAPVHLADDDRRKVMLREAQSP